MANLKTRQIMLLVLLALFPGMIAMSYFYGMQFWMNLAFASAFGSCIEALCLRLQGRSLRLELTDGSTPVTCILLCCALPPGTELWIIAIAVTASIGLAKHLYGGLGNNVFNPAMVGYAVVLVSFPKNLALWPIPLDGTTAATALTSFKYRQGATVDDIWTIDQGFGSFGGYGWEWINLCFVVGGALLVALRIAQWRVPAAMLASLAICALIGYDNGGPHSLGSPMFHYFSGSTMLVAFFIATDPVTHPVTHRGQLLFGCLVGCLTFTIRMFGNYPDGTAFAILLANSATPYLDKRLVAARG
ncbi:MAG: RnfABCDGE type electron transport complex subunit D [Gammaproteobacteria bacterium]|nr:RnfABCDGE type electron transport complex subunit D [Gammaproteobacteria bacterium]